MFAETLAIMFGDSKIWSAGIRKYVSNIFITSPKFLYCKKLFQVFYGTETSFRIVRYLHHMHIKLILMILS